MLSKKINEKYYEILKGTIDEDIMKALASKDMTQNRLIAAVKARVTHGR